MVAIWVGLDSGGLVDAASVAENTRPSDVKKLREDYGRVYLVKSETVTLGRPLPDDAVIIDKNTLRRWTEQARRDDWHQTFVGSDIRQMLAEIERLITLDEMAKRLRAAGWTIDPPERMPKWPDRVTSSDTECSYEHCRFPDECKHDGCVRQRAITWADAPEIH
jgi:hypothetical protein